MSIVKSGEVVIPTTSKQEKYKSKNVHAYSMEGDDYPEAFFDGLDDGL